MQKNWQILPAMWFHFLDESRRNLGIFPLLGTSLAILTHRRIPRALGVLLHLYMHHYCNSSTCCERPGPRGKGKRGFFFTEKQKEVNKMLLLATCNFFSKFCCYFFQSLPQLISGGCRSTIPFAHSETAWNGWEHSNLLLSDKLLLELRRHCWINCCIVSESLVALKTFLLLRCDAGSSESKGVTTQPRRVEN